MKSCIQMSVIPSKNKKNLLFFIVFIKLKIILKSEFYNILQYKLIYYKIN